jgi:hypothetical protein
MGACLDDFVAVRLGTVTAAEEGGGEQGARRGAHNRCHEHGDDRRSARRRPDDVRSRSRHETEAVFPQGCRVRLPTEVWR